jgi:hypothetical protein
MWIYQVVDNSTVCTGPPDLNSVVSSSFFFKKDLFCYANRQYPLFPNRRSAKNISIGQIMLRTLLKSKSILVKT